MENNVKKKVNSITKNFLIIISLIIIINLCVIFGSVNITLWDTSRIILGSITGNIPSEIPGRLISIVIGIRLPRVLMSGLVGASLSISGVAMQGLLKNPLADSSTLGVSSGASLGAVIAIAFSGNNVLVANLGVFAMSVLFAFISICFILILTKIIDSSLSTNTVILIGVIFSMFASSITSLIITVASKAVKSIIFWSLGSFSASTYKEVLLMSCSLVFCSFILIRYGVELNAFAVGEENAMYVGVNVRRIKLKIMAVVSVLIGFSVAMSGTIGFVGLVIPHMTRLITGPNHKKLIPMSVCIGAGFLMMADLVSRTLFTPIELPIGVVTSFIGSVLFVILMIKRKC